MKNYSAIRTVDDTVETRQETRARGSAMNTNPRVVVTGIGMATFQLHGTPGVLELFAGWSLRIRSRQEL